MRLRYRAMIVGAHVSTAGGLSKAIPRGEEIGANAIQIFNQSPRMWKPTNYSQADFDQFRDLVKQSSIESVVIHAVYLINCASKEPELKEKSLASLTQALRVGDGIGADGVVLHPGSCKGEPVEEAIERVAEALVTCIGATERCSILLENTAGAGGTLGRDFGQLAEIVGQIKKLDSSSAKRVGVCLDSCHLFAAGFDITTKEKMAAVIDSFDSEVGLERLRCIHLNDSMMPLGSNRDRHANLGDGEIGKDGLKAFLAEPRLKGLPIILEVPGAEKKGPDARQIAIAKGLCA